MKSAFLNYSCLFYFLLSFPPVQGQVTITADDFPRAATFTDTIHRSLPGNIPIPSPGEDQLWDYSGLTLNELIEIEYSGEGFDSTLNEALNKRENDRIFQGFVIDAEEYEAQDETGWYVLGQTTEEVAYSIAVLTGGSNDTLRFSASAGQYGGRINNVQFPLNYGDQWTQTRVEVQPYALSVAAFGLNNTPGTFNRYITEEREITGWGELILPDADGVATLPIPVLMLSVNQTEIDSVFLGGAPAPTALMNAFGLSQGSTASSRFDVFYTPGFGAPVFSLEDDDDKAFYRPQAAATISGIRDLELVNTQVSPNPVQAGQLLRMQLQEPIEHAQVVVTDLHGRQLLIQAIDQSSGLNIEIPIPTALAAGIYTYQIKNGTGH